MLVRGLESAAKGMLALMEAQDNIANNLSNVNTTGFKRGQLRFKDIMESAVYQYGMLRAAMQEHILEKLQFLIDQKFIRGTFEYGTE